MVTPAFSVVIATFDRGVLIEPTLESVARQTLDDIEVLVVSDGPAAAGLADTVDRFGDRFRLVETTARCGSQFAPNNQGWSMAAGRWIAYLGHDDIWLPHHLARLRDAFERRPDADFVASGCLYFGPPGSGDGHAWVTGLFDPHDRSAARTHFFPPSSVGHRRLLADDLRWPDAAQVRRPVDSQFMLTAALRGCVFTSTGTISVLKFNSALRYLSYLTPDDDEQRAALAWIDDGERLDAAIAAAVADAERSGNHMTTGHPPEGDRRPGDPVRVHARVRGIDLPPMMALSASTWMPLGDDPRAYDWHGPEGDGQRSWRWSGPNPRPRLLVPYTCGGPVWISLHVDAFAADDVRDSLEVLVDRRSVPHALRPGSGVSPMVVEFETPLRADRPSVVELRMSRTVPASELAPGSVDARRLGMCLAGVHLAPLK